LLTTSKEKSWGMQRFYSRVEQSAVRDPSLRSG